MLNICDLPVINIRISNNGNDLFRLEFLISPSENKTMWVLQSNIYVGCRSFGAKDMGSSKEFKTYKQALEYIKNEYGRYGISITIDNHGLPIKYV